MSLSKGPTSEQPTRVIERVGTCLDGDNCPRYHCRECGEYWLGNLEHVCGVSPPLSGTASSHQQLVQTISQWMTAALKRNNDVLTIASWDVIQQIKAADMGDALLDAYGDRLVIELWREHQKAANPAPVNGHATSSPTGAAARALPEYRHTPRPDRTAYGQFETRGSRSNNAAG